MRYTVKERIDRGSWLTMPVCRYQVFLLMLTIWDEERPVTKSHLVPHPINYGTKRSWFVRVVDYTR